MREGWWRAALDLVLPLTCPGCGAPEPWCARCASTLGPPRPVRLPDSTLDRRTGPLPPVRALSRWHGPVRQAVLAAKERGRRDLPPLLARSLAPAVLSILRWELPDGPVFLVPAAGRQLAARRRGGDPVAVMAGAAARLLRDQGMPVRCAPVLCTAGSARDSVGLHGHQRWQNLQGRITPVPGARLPAGAAVVLIDDVVTSGATALLSARALRSGWPRARVISVLALATAAPWLPTPGPRLSGPGAAAPPVADPAAPGRLETPGQTR